VKHLCHGSSVPDKALAALTISLMLNEGHVPDTEMTESNIEDIHTALFGALNTKGEEEFVVRCMNTGTLS